MSPAIGDQVAPLPGDEPKPAVSDMARLADGVPRLPQPAFAVVDGAQWDDFPSALATAGLRGRSLLLGAGEDVEAAGPWLVALDQRPDASNAVLEMLDAKPAAVFWGCPAGEAALWRHLRTLAQVDMASPPNPDARDARSGTEVVTFRYWDPRAISSMLRVLDAGQFARVLGPAAELLFVDPLSMGGVGVARVVNLPDWPPAPRGRLALSGEQVVKLDAVMRDRSHHRIGYFLCEVAPEETTGLTRAQVLRFVQECEDEGRLAGLVSERAHGRWAYMALTTGGAFGRDGTVLGYIMQGGGVPDTNLDRLFEEMTKLAEADAFYEGGL